MSGLCEPRQVGILEAGDVRVLAKQPPRKLGSVLRPAFDGQEFGDLIDQEITPDLTLQAIVVKNGYVAIGPGWDGAVFTEDGRLVRETWFFSEGLTGAAIENLLASSTRLPTKLFSCVDCAWRNYYHWICLALPKAALAQRWLEPGLRIALPDYSDPARTHWPMTFSRKVWSQSLEATGLAPASLILPSGCYQAPEINLVWANHEQPGFLFHFEEFASALKVAPTRMRLFSPRKPRLLVQRPYNPRLDAAVSVELSTIAKKAGFETVRLEQCDFQEQVNLFARAKAVVGAHGAGLSNMVFAPSSLAVLELNSLIEEERTLRPWFYLIAEGKKQRYSYLNGSNGDFTTERLAEAIRRLL